MNKIPTAEELELLFEKAINYQFVFGDEEDKIKRSASNCKEIAIKFAKLHVKAALEFASKLDFESIVHPEANDYEEAVSATIKECYPETNIV